MQELEYASIAIAWAHTKSLAHEIDWHIDKKTITTELIAGITITFNFVDEGPDSAVWQDVMIKNPVGQGWTMVINPGGRMAHLGGNLATGSTLDRINEIFTLVLLEPRQKVFAAAMAALQGT